MAYRATQFTSYKKVITESITFERTYMYSAWFPVFAKTFEPASGKIEDPEKERCCQIPLICALQIDYELALLEKPCYWSCFKINRTILEIQRKQQTIPLDRFPLKIISTLSYCTCIKPSVAPIIFTFLFCCWFSPLLREVFLRVLRFSPLLKNQHFQIPIQSGIG